MNPFKPRMAGRSWVLPVSVMSLGVGYLVASAWLTRDNLASRWNALTLGQQERRRISNISVEEELAQLNKEYETTREEVKKLREENTKLQSAMADDDKLSSVLSENLEDIKSFAGLTELSGPGVVVTLRDSKNTSDMVDVSDGIIHDRDVMVVVNELRASGADGISVNNKRVGPNTSFRCVGPTILVDGARIATPVVVRAIGDQEALTSALNMPGGPLDEIRRLDPNMVSVEPARSLRLPAFAGSTSVKVGKVVRDEP